MSGSRTVVVIGYGNRWFGDDAAGPLVVDRLESHLADLPEASRRRLTRIACPQLLPELAEPLAAAERAIFVDAGVDLAAGRVGCRRVRPEAGRTLGHTFLPSALLHLARTAFGRAPHSRLYTIGAERLERFAEPSPAVCEAVDRLANRLARHLVRWLDSPR